MSMRQALAHQQAVKVGKWASGGRIGSEPGVAKGDVRAPSRRIKALMASYCPRPRPGMVADKFDLWISPRIGRGQSRGRAEEANGVEERAKHSFEGADVWEKSCAIADQRFAPPLDEGGLRLLY